MDAQGPQGSELSKGNEVAEWDGKVNGVSAKGRRIR